MPLVTGRVRDFGLGDLVGRKIRLVFTPSNRVAVDTEGLLMGPVVVRPEDINAATGNFSVQLAQTTLLRPATHFNVRAEWFSRTGDYIDGMSYLNYPLHVPAAGGRLATLLRLPPPANALAVAPESPGELVAVGKVWIDTSGGKARIRRRSK